MKEFYVTFERQGNAEIVVKVIAETEDDAYEIARDTLINSMYDSFATTERPDDCMVVDESGEEI